MAMASRLLLIRFSYCSIGNAAHWCFSSRMSTRLLAARHKSEANPTKSGTNQAEKTKTGELKMAGKDDGKEAKRKKKSDVDMAEYELRDFFDVPGNWGKKELTDSRRPGRSWSGEELRLKNSGDLHKLWYLLLKERNMLLTMEHAYKIRNHAFPCPERLDRVKESMDNLEAVVHERNDAFLRLETGNGASPPKRTITSFAGFTHQEFATEHYEPFEVTGGKKEYEVPLLDDQAYLTQKLWREKENMRREIAIDDEYLMKDPERATNFALVRGRRKHFDRLEDLPKHVVARRKERMENVEPPNEPI